MEGMDAGATGSSFASTLDRRRCEAIGAGSGTLRQLDTPSPVVGLPRQCSVPTVPLRPGRFAMHEAPTMSADWNCILRCPQSSTPPCSRSGDPLDLERLPGSTLDGHRRHRRRLPSPIRSRARSGNKALEQSR